MNHTPRTDDRGGATLRPGTIVATGCLALLSVWNAADGALAFAAMFAVLSVANLGFALGMTRWGHAASAAAALPPPSSAHAREEIARQRRARTQWLRIAVGGWVVAVAAVFYFPPLSLVLAALSLYSTLRCGRSGRTLLHLIERGTDA